VFHPHLADLLSRCRDEAPEVEIRLTEVSLTEQLRGLRNDIFDAGFACHAESEPGIITHQIWSDPLVVAVPARHPLLSFKQIPLEELLRYPLVMYHPEWDEGYYRQLEKILRIARVEPTVTEYASSLNMLFMLVAAGYGTGLVTASQIAMTNYPNVVKRSLAAEEAVLHTFLLAPEIEPSSQLSDFIKRVTNKSGMDGDDRDSSDFIP
jgi:DNA-binding transcriptional LysR family regulator